MRESQRYIPKNQKFTASDMHRHVETHANALLDLDFMPGETLGIWMPDGPERVGIPFFVIAYFLFDAASVFDGGCQSRYQCGRD